MNYTLHLPLNYQKIPLPWLTPWLAALRSGEYPQGRGFLCYSGKYCCLGVLSKIQGRLQQKDEGWVDGAGGSFGSLAIKNPCAAVLSQGGSFAPGVWVTFRGLDHKCLWRLNDNGLPFSDIADILETLYVDAPV